MKFLSKPEKQDMECQENFDIASTSTALNPGTMDVSEEKDVCFSEEEFIKAREGTAKEPISNLSSSVICSNLDCGDDPGLWPASMTNDYVNILVSRCPVQVSKFDFPINDDGRKFTNNYYYRNLPNGEKINREWLVYSISKDSVYCFCCKIFGKSVSSLSSLDGFSNWQHLSLTLKRHETSISHSENVKSWVQLNNMLKNKTTVNQMQLRLLESEKKQWCDVLERIIAVIKFLSHQCLAFRGSSKTLYEHDNGNFLKAIEMIASFDTVMREHIHRIQFSKSDSSRLTHYLGDQIQNEIIDMLGTNIKENILNKVRESKYFSIILDCTPDVSHTEQITVVLRHVVLNNKTNNVEICENFVGFCPITSSTGEGLLNFVLDLFSQLNLNIQNLRGQGYDNGSNMRGKKNGLQKKILDINNRAFYVPCSAHSLNLVVNDAVNITHETVNFFNIIQEIYVFFSSSTKKWSIICKHLPGLKLKALSATRWSSRIDAVKPLRHHLEKIFDALLEISDNSSEWDCTISHKAHSLALSIQSYRFICSVVIWFDILNEINGVSKIIQSPIINNQICITLLNNLINKFTTYRTGEHFETVLAEASKVAHELNVETNFPPINTIRPRRKPTQFQYEHNDEVLIDPKIKYRVEFYFRILDQTITSLKNRFEELKTFTEVFGFLSANLLNCSNDDLMKHCKDLYLKLKDDSSSESDIDGIDLFNEIIALKLHFTENQTNEPQTLLQYLYANDLISTFPNTAIVLRILLTLPVSVASGERSFSKLKIIKNYLRSTMLQQRLSNLALVSIEHEILDSLDTRKLIEDFANIKARRVKFL